MERILKIEVRNGDKEKDSGCGEDGLRLFIKWLTGGKDRDKKLHRRKL